MPKGERKRVRCQSAGRTQTKVRAYTLWKRASGDHKQDTEIGIMFVNAWPSLACSLTGTGLTRSELGRFVTDAFASSSFISSRIAAALALSSSGDGGINPVALLTDTEALRLAVMGRGVRNAATWVTHSAPQASESSFMVASNIEQRMLKVFHPKEFHKL